MAEARILTVMLIALHDAEIHFLRYIHMRSSIHLDSQAGRSMKLLLTALSAVNDAGTPNSVDIESKARGIARDVN